MLVFKEGKCLRIMRKVVRGRCIAFLGSTFLACTQPGDPIYEEYELSEVGEIVDFATNIQPIFENNCSPCHLGGGGSAGVFLDDHEATMASGSVEPCDPEKSSLYLALQDPPPDGILKMPLGGELSSEEIETIRLWISQGAAPDASSPQLCGDPAVPGDVASSDSKE